MIIWVAALVLLAGLGALGYLTGAIRVAFSLAGLLVGAILAVPLSPVVRPVLAMMGLRHPLWSHLLAPVLVFLLVLIVFKISARVVHRKVDVHFKYKRTDDDRLLFTRLNQRLGFCLGLLNGAIYLILILVSIYVSGYLLVQLETGNEDPAGMRFISKARADLRSTHMDRVVARYDPAPEAYYDAADILGLWKQNPLLSSRMSRYPVFLSLGERPELQALATDVEVNQMFQSQANLLTLVKHPKVQALVNSRELAAELSRLLASDLKDLKDFLVTGRSEKYGAETLLGRWVLEIDASLAQERKKRPTISSVELNRLKKVLQGNMAGATLTATTDNRIFLKGGPDANGQTPVLSEGTWQKSGDRNYQIIFAERNQSSPVVFQGEDQLIVVKDGMTLFFEREL